MQRLGIARGREASQQRTGGIDEGRAADSQRQRIALQRQRQHRAKARQLPVQRSVPVQMRAHCPHGSLPPCPNPSARVWHPLLWKALLTLLNFIIVTLSLICGCEAYFQPKWPRKSIPTSMHRVSTQASCMRPFKSSLKQQCRTNDNHHLAERLLHAYPQR